MFVITSHFQSSMYELSIIYSRFPYFLVFHSEIRGGTIRPRHKLTCLCSAVFLPMVARLLYFGHVCDGFDTRIILDIGELTKLPG